MPMNSDNENRAGDTRWQIRGIGLQPTFRCAGCDKASQPLGSRRIGPFRLPYCAKCVPDVLAAIAARKAAREAARAAAATQEAAPCL